MISINSITDRSNLQLVKFLAPLLKESGLRVETQTVRERGKAFVNLLGFSHPKSRPLLALNTHLDTVSGGESARWTATGGDPFKLTIKGDKAYGLGSADVKLDFLCKLNAARLARPWRFPFVLVGTFGEERGLIGAEHLLRSQKIRPRFALIGEPSNMALIYAHKGHLVGELSMLWKDRGKPQTKRRWDGQAAHSSTPHLGDNAIEKALREIFERNLGIVSLQGGTEYNRIPEACTGNIIPEAGPSTEKLKALISRLHQLRTELEFTVDKRFDPATPTLSITLLKIHNGVCTLTFDVRLLPGVNARKLQSRIRKIADVAGFKVTRLACDPPLSGNKEDAWIQLCKRTLRKVTKEARIETKASSTEAALYYEYGAQAIVFGPGVSVGNVHRPNEHCLLSQMKTATEFYKSVLELPLGDL